MQERSCSVWDWGGLVAQAEGWDAELVSFGVSSPPSASTCLWKCCGELLPAPVKVGKVIKML